MPSSVPLTYNNVQVGQGTVYSVDLVIKKNTEQKHMCQVTRNVCGCTNHNFLTLRILYTI